MAIRECGSLLYQDALRQLARELDNTPHGGRGALCGQFADRWGKSVATVNRHLKGIGWTSGRKPRADRGATRQCMEALTHLSAAQRLSVRKNGKVTMETPNARSMLQANGRPFAVGNARLNTLLRERQMDVRRQAQDRACQPLRSLHPNHVHLVDPSLCLIYYEPDGTQHIIRDDQFYKNKPDNVARIEKWKVWRYVLADHYSGTIMVRYYAARGETQANMYDFLLYCWKRLEGRPFHGVPLILYWDKGSANTAGAIQLALRALVVEAIDHSAGNPRAKGAVEQANNLVEKLFESRLRFEPVASVDELNAAIEGWYNAYNADSIPHYDSRLKRRYMREPKARYALWQIIRQEQLRLLPDEDVCRYLLSAEPVERKVGPDLTVSIRHPVSKRREWYDVSGLPNVYPNAAVRVSPLIYGHHQVVVYVDDYKGEESAHVLEPVAGDEFSGFRLDAAVIGQEMKAQPDTLVEQAGKAADRAAFPGRSLDEIEKAKDKNITPFDGALDAHSHLQHVDRPAYMARPGSEMSVPDRVNMEVKPLSTTEACKQLMATLGRMDGVNYYELVSEWYPEGVPLDEFDALVQRIRNPQPTTGLALVK